jgi:hypothetical protein
MTPNEAKKFARSDYITGLITNIAADMTTQTTMEYLRATAKGEPWPPEEDLAGEDEIADEIEEAGVIENKADQSEEENQPEDETDSKQDEASHGDMPDDENKDKEIETGIDVSGDENEVDVSDSEENNKSKEK